MKNARPSPVIDPASSATQGCDIVIWCIKSGPAGQALGSHGFTLVELLVVVGIISTLVAILLPALNKARLAAEDIQCLSNFRQIGIALTAYQNDYRGVFPVNLYGVTGNRQDCWDFELAPYLGLHPPDGPSYTVLPQNTASVLRCPRDWRSGDPRWYQARSYTATKISSSRPGDGVFWSGVGTPAPPKVSSLSHPSTTVVMTEWEVGFDQPGGGNRAWSFAYCHVDGWLGLSGIPKGAGEKFYHGGKMDFLFADGHAKLCDPQDAYRSTPTWWTR